jgi:hypothetical protein
MFLTGGFFFRFLLGTLLVSITGVLGAPTSSSLKNGIAGVVDPTTPCNGSPDLCGRKYSNVTFIGTHDSAFVGKLPTQNQNKAIGDQLAAGIRFLQGQTHMFMGTPTFCHTSCLEEDAGSVKSWLLTVKQFLDDNPTEVVTILWTNPDKISMQIFAGIFEAVAADKYVFTPPTTDPVARDAWPTLGQMIAANTRLVAFIGTFVCFQFQEQAKLTGYRLRCRPNTSPIPSRRV